MRVLGYLLVSRFMLGFAWIALALALPAAAFAQPPLTVERVAFFFAFPVFATAPPGDSTRLFIVELHTGNIKILNLGTGVTNPTPFHTQLGVAQGGEQGLLGLAFHPSYATNGFFYVNYTRVSDGAIVVRRYSVSANPDRSDSTTGATLLTIPKYIPAENHNGGWIAFGDDGYLYIAVGDGGPTPWTAQSDTTRLGKILRLDVDGGLPYAIPPSNPFVNEPSPANEIWAMGLRNPWRPSFDRGMGDLYIADVGATAWEELNFQPASSPGGENYGWPLFEGYAKLSCPFPCDSAGLTRPVHVYDHGDPQVRCAITGGYVYRGADIPGLAGHYFFADFCSHQIWSLRIAGGAATEITERTAELQPGGALDMDFITSFGEDARGELYICNFDGDIYRIIADPTSVGLPQESEAAPAAVMIEAVTPNPSRGAFAVHVRSTARLRASLGVFDASGRRVRVLPGGELLPGSHVLSWDGRDEHGRRVAPGTYLFMLDAENARAARKVAVVR